MELVITFRPQSGEIAYHGFYPTRSGETYVCWCSMRCDANPVIYSSKEEAYRNVSLVNRLKFQVIPLEEFQILRVMVS